MAARSSLEAARRQAAARGGAAAAAAMSSRLPFFLPRLVRTAPAGIFLRRAFNILFQPWSRSSRTTVDVGVRAAQRSMDDAAPAQRGHHGSLAGHLSQPKPPRAHAVCVCGQWGSRLAARGLFVLPQRARPQKAAGGECSDAKWARPPPLAMRAGGGRAI